MARTTVYLPADLLAAMRHYPEVNWSSVCQRAIRFELAKHGVTVRPAQPLTVITSTEREDRHA